MSEEKIFDNTEIAFKLKSDEDWRKTFCGKCAADRPIWNAKVKMCARWQIKGDCFDDCAHATSHIAKSTIPAEKVTAFKAWMEKVRQS